MTCYRQSPGRTRYQTVTRAQRLRLSANAPFRVRSYAKIAGQADRFGETEKLVVVIDKIEEEVNHRQGGKMRVVKDEKREMKKVSSRAEYRRFKYCTRFMKPATIATIVIKRYNPTREPQVVWRCPYLRDANNDSSNTLVGVIPVWMGPCKGIYANEGQPKIPRS